MRPISRWTYYSLIGFAAFAGKLLVDGDFWGVLIIVYAIVNFDL